jgi:hypothetical protein
MIWMYRPLIVTQKVPTNIRFLQTETLFAPFSPTSAEGGDSETTRDSRDKQSGKSRVKKAAYAAVLAEPRGGPSPPTSLTSTAKSMRFSRATRVLRRLIPRLSAFAYSAARAFEPTQARSRFSFGAGGLVFLDLEIQCDNRSR